MPKQVKKPASRKTKVSRIQVEAIDPVTQYARDVVSGATIAGPLVRLAGQRHLDDVATGALRGLAWRYETAKPTLDFFPDCLRLAGGEHEDKPFALHPSQVFIVGSLFGWRIAATNQRRFRIAYVEEGKGNGKSPLAAGIGAYMLTDGEQRAEVYFAATDKDQAKIAFRDMVAAVDLSPQLDGRIRRSGGIGREYQLAYLKTNSFAKPISSENQGRGKSGLRVYLAILDEVHEHPTNSMVEFMRGGTKGRPNALVFMITNSGVISPTSVCWDYHQLADRVLTGKEKRDSMFFYVCGLDEDDDIEDESCWPKANPLLGVSIDYPYIREQVDEALGMPSKLSLVRRLNFCSWEQSSNPFVDNATWKACGDTVRPIEELRGRSCVAAIDLANKNALASLTLMFDPDEDGRCDVLCYFWTPKGGLKERIKRDKVNYQAWIDAGHIEATPGNVIDYGFIAKRMLQLAADFDVRCFAYDRWRVENLKKEIEDAGGTASVGDNTGLDVVLVEHDQGFKDMDFSIQALEDDLKDNVSVLEDGHEAEFIRHGNNPVLSWCIGNARVEMNKDKLRKFSRMSSTGHIDGAITLAMCSGVRRRFKSNNTSSITVITDDD